MAILEYLEVEYPTSPLLPNAPLGAAKIRAAANIIACDIHPVNNLKVVTAIKSMGHSQDEAVTWMNDWMLRGLQAFEKLLPEDTDFSFGDTPTLADVCLIPQLFNAHRWGTDLSSLTRLTEIETRCLTLIARWRAVLQILPDRVPRQSSLPAHRSNTSPVT